MMALNCSPNPYRTNEMVDYISGVEGLSKFGSWLPKEHFCEIISKLNFKNVKFILVSIPTIIIFYLGHI